MGEVTKGGSTRTSVTVVWADEPGADDAADLLLTREAARLLGTREGILRVVRVCPRCGSAGHGRPMVAGGSTLHVSISRAGPVTVVALTSAGFLGVDVEREDAAGFPGFDAVVLDPAEPPPSTVRERTRLWVRHEAAVKAMGVGITALPARQRVRAPVHATTYDVPTAPGYVTAVTCLAEGPLEVLVRKAVPAGRAGGAMSRTAPRVSAH